MEFPFWKMPHFVLTIGGICSTIDFMDMKNVWMAGRRMVILCVISCFMLCGCEKENTKYFTAGRHDEEFSWQTPSPSTVLYVLNTSSRRIHLPDCRYVQAMSQEHLREIDDVSQALAEGYTACGHCHPNTDTENEDRKHEE